ncbi:hypothetical protein EJ06DRAFT_177948 [Trichodelitschia bisporula]|uniref:Rhodopsin domain-containing protein n=1 Tax=Trichodelitschia bisporula TaxID=703511 RepID=A0A6G1HLY1_9PEZI|nr:hypothetical protein EJ06DRAFT_177948 [Trichodelitschia bisporula]
MVVLQEKDPEFLAEMIIWAQKFPDFPTDMAPWADPEWLARTNYQRCQTFSIIMGIISTIVLCARLWARRRVKGMVFGWDDWWIIPGQVLSLILMVIQLLMFHVGGLGHRAYALSLKRILISQKLEFAAVIVYFTAVTCIRISITCFLYRLMALTSRTKRRILDVTVVIIVMSWVLQCLLFIFAFDPIAAAWDFKLRLHAHENFDLANDIFIFSIIYLITDIWLLILPLHTVWTMRLPLRTRLGVTWIFIFGGVACAGAILKCVFIYPVFHSYDPLWNGVGFTTGSSIEVTFGIISSSMPALNHLLTKKLPNTVESVLGSERYTRWFGSGSSSDRQNAPRSFKDSFMDGAKHISRVGNMHVPIDEEAPPLPTLRDEGDVIGKETMGGWYGKGGKAGDVPSETSQEQVFSKNINDESWLHVP